MMKKIKVDKNWIMVGLFLILFIIWSILVVNGNLLDLDYNIFDILHTTILNDFLTSFLKILTYMGSASILLIITIISLLFLKDKFIGISMGINGFSIYLLNLLLKNIFVIPRPDIITFIEENGYSYPSGHAMASFAFYGFLIYLINKKMKPSFFKKLLIVLLVLLILSIGFSRIYLGVHHFSDIIGGYFISFAYLIIFIKFMGKLGRKRKNEVQKRN